MIIKINKIRNLGLVFSNYAWDAGLAAFKQVNLVYGWNGCGKTTFSRFFDSINGPPLNDLEFEFEDETGKRYRQGEAFLAKIRVFNHDYVQKNVKLVEGRANSISILLGAENKELVGKIESDRKLLTGDASGSLGKITLLVKHQTDRRNVSRERDDKFTEIAKTIGAAIGGKALRDYRKPQAEKDFAALTMKAELIEKELAKHSLSAKQESMPNVEPLALRKSKFPGEKEERDTGSRLKSAVSQAEALLAEKVESERIDRLMANSDIAAWVEQGIQLHREHASKSCEYCLQAVPNSRAKQLGLHFNEAERGLKEAVDALIKIVEQKIGEVVTLEPPDAARIYGQFRVNYENALAEFDEARKLLRKELTKLRAELVDKKSRTAETVPLAQRPSADGLCDKLVALNRPIQDHNQTTANFEAVRVDAIKKLKDHYLSTIFDAVKHLEGEAARLGKEIQSLQTEIAEIETRISENMAKVSSKHKACEAINGMLTTFLGHQELAFVPFTEKDPKMGVDDVVGYSIMRGKDPAVYLSEGEKTAIAFVYFVVQLGDRDFDVKSGIIVIDDPISSLDSNSLYQAFSFLKNAVKDAKQVFILTHSFDFLKLLINWRRHGGGAGYYMVKNNFPAGLRCAYIAEMDKELCKYESEYHYLFRLLKQMKAEQDGSIAKAYPIPNIARKVWDTFLMFSVPIGDPSPYKKMEELKKAGFDAQKLDAVYKFTNDQSHITGNGFNPALVPEAKKVVGELFELIEKISPNHFKFLDAATN